jgi:TRAP-type uncharacterized transport system fused permease subunit
MLIVTPEFTWPSFLFVTFCAMAGIVLLSAAFAGYALAPLRAWERWLAGIAALPIIAPELISTLIGLALAAPVVVSQLSRARTARTLAPA